MCQCISAQFLEKGLHMNNQIYIYLNVREHQDDTQDAFSGVLSVDYTVNLDSGSRLRIAATSVYQGTLPAGQTVVIV